MADSLDALKLRQFRLRDPLTLPPAALVGSEGDVCGAIAPTDVAGTLAEDSDLRLLKSALAEGIRMLSEGDAREMYLRWRKRENLELTGDDLERLEGLSTRALVYPDEPAAKLRPSVGDYLRCNLGTMRQSESCYEQGLGFFREYMDRKHPRKDKLPSPR